MVVEEAEPTQISRLEGPPPGTILLGKYRVDGLLGIGGYGYVVRAHHLELAESVAIKILRDDREIDELNLARFVREAQAIVRLKTEHVARVFDVGRLPSGAPYMVMELLEGEDLGQRLDAGALDPTLAVDYILQACEALAESHNIGIVHRDIKPTNLFVARRAGGNDGREVVKVLDFGISKATRRDHEESLRLTQTQSVLGTPAYMSPEQMRSAKSVDARTDIWALGAVLYELVERQLPFDADNFAELCVVVATQPPRPMVRAPVLEPLIHRCLAKRVEERFASVADLAVALAPYASPGLAAEYLPRIHRAADRPITDPSLARGPSDAAKRPTPAHADEMTIREPRRSRSHILWIGLVCGVLAGGTVALVSMRQPAAAIEPVATPTTPPPKVEPPPLPPPPPRVEPKVEDVAIEAPPPPVDTKPRPAAVNKPPVHVERKVEKVERVERVEPRIEKPATPPCDPSRSMMGCK